MSADQSRILRFSPEISTEAYEAGDQMGEVENLPFAFQGGNDSASALSLTVIDKDAQNADLDVLLFSEAPDAGDDNASAAISIADLGAKLLGVIKVTSDDYAAVGEHSVATVHGIGLMLEATQGDAKSLHAVVISRGAPTYTAADSLTFKLGILQD